MNQKQVTLLEEISKKAVDIDWNVAFGGKSKGNSHLFRVNKIAKYLLEREGGNEFIVLVTAWVHDVSLAFGNDNNSKLVYEHTLSFLQQFDLDQDIRTQISQAASGHETSGVNKKEAQIVHDADVLDKSGTLGIIRHIWKMTNLIENRILNKGSDLSILEKDLQIRQSRLFTFTGKRLFKELEKLQSNFFSDDKAFQTMEEISVKANKGLISDAIAQEIIESNRNSDISHQLRFQLDCKFLN